MQYLVPLPSQEVLNSLFVYDPESGILSRRKTGKVCGSQCNGYLVVGVEDINFRIHRLIWKLVHGVDPNIIDHVNRNRADNSLANLRNCTHSQNARNRFRKTLSGYKGTHQLRATGKYYALVCVGNSRLLHLGTWQSADEAALAYNIGAALLSDFSHLNVIESFPTGSAAKIAAQVLAKLHDHLSDGPDVYRGG